MGVPARHLVTVQAEDAHAAATDDRAAAADLVLQLAVNEAVDLVRQGDVGYAVYRLERARMSAQRILGASEDPS